MVVVHKGHLMTARGGVAEHLRAASPASRERTNMKEQLGGGGGHRQINKQQKTLERK